MSCQKCGFCQANLPTFENITVDARSRGNYRIATMLDEALERCGILRENLQANNREYLKNISRMVKKQSSSDVCTNLLRDAKQVVQTTKGRQSSEPTRRGTGFGNMLEGARSGTEGDEESQPETRQSGFQKPEPEIRGGWGFRAMLDGASRGNATGESVETRDDAKPIPCGLAAMLEAISPTEPRDTLNEKSHIKRGMGFAAMLEGARSGTE